MPSFRARSLLLRAPLLLIGVALAAPSALAGARISISCSSLGVEAELCRTGAEEWAKKTGNEVSLVATPPNADERFSLYLTLLASRSSDVDVLQIDVTWPGMLVSHLVDLTPLIPENERADHLPVLIANDTVDGKLIAAPFFVDVGLLYYRKDLLERYGKPVPKTWRELTDVATEILKAERAKGSGDLQGFVFQGKAYEGLACNALEWIASSDGAIVDAKGRVTAEAPENIAALTMAKAWIGTIAPRGVLGYAEEETRTAFQSGKAIFMRNWPYAWALGNAKDSPVSGRIGVTALPRGDGPRARSATTLGGQQLAVSKYSAHVRQAADLVRYLTGAEEQKRRALKGSFNPTRAALYRDPELIASNPLYQEFPAILDGAVARPSTVSGRRYNKVSYAIIQAVHDALSGAGSPEDNLAALGEELNRISHDGAWN
ncbi:ABC transporter substrate-binding protein [Terrarubrum flagellatum]|uniref:ABC transporter substrate-binding protein n=1 Tax=Terrirubrum flagellatum TaxID=2895980 RepID=UPI00314519BC